MAKTLEDMSLEELRNHLEQWHKDRVGGTAGYPWNLYDTNQLIAFAKEADQDITELIHICRGILLHLTAPKGSK